MSGAPRGPVELSAGCRLMLDGAEWQVRQFEPHTGRVLLRRDDGQELATTVRALVSHGDCRPAAGPPHSRAVSRPGLKTSPKGERVHHRPAPRLDATGLIGAAREVTGEPVSRGRSPRVTPRPAAV